MHTDQEQDFEFVTEQIDEYVLDKHTPFAFFHKKTGWIIEVVQVAFGYRVTLRELGSGGLEANWCAGDKYEDIVFLLDCMAGYVLNDKYPPFQSHVKPYHRDAEFKQEIEKYRVDGAIDFPIGMYQLLRIIAPVGLENFLHYVNHK